MMIESGTTSDRRNRIVIFMVVCFAFAAWFARDGYVAYPAENLEWAQQQLPQIPEGLEVNPKAVLANLQRVEVGTGVAEMEGLLGKPVLIHEQKHWYIGPAAYGCFLVLGDKVRQVEVRESGEHSESSLRTQKVFFMGMSVLGLVALGHLIRVTKLRVVLDDAGLKIRGRTIRWEEMESLDSGDYARKGWVDLVVRTGAASEPIRIDSYLIERFDDIVQAICERKGFTAPFTSQSET